MKKLFKSNLEEKNKFIFMSHGPDNFDPREQTDSPSQKPKEKTAAEKTAETRKKSGQLTNQIRKLSTQGLGKCGDKVQKTLLDMAGQKIDASKAESQLSNICEGKDDKKDSLDKNNSENKPQQPSKKKGEQPQTGKQAKKEDKPKKGELSRYLKKAHELAEKAKQEEIKEAKKSGGKIDKKSGIAKATDGFKTLSSKGGQLDDKMSKGADGKEGDSQEGSGEGDKVAKAAESMGNMSKAQSQKEAGMEKTYCSRLCKKAAKKAGVDTSKVNDMAKSFIGNGGGEKGHVAIALNDGGSQVWNPNGAGGKTEIKSASRTPVGHAKANKPGEKASGEIQRGDYVVYDRAGKSNGSGQTSVG